MSPELRCCECTENRWPVRCPGLHGAGAAPLRKDPQHPLLTYNVSCRRTLVSSHAPRRPKGHSPVLGPAPVPRQVQLCRPLRAPGPGQQRGRGCVRGQAPAWSACSEPVSHEAPSRGRLQKQPRGLSPAVGSGYRADTEGPAHGAPAEQARCRPQAPPPPPWLAGFLPTHPGSSGSRQSVEGQPFQRGQEGLLVGAAGTAE